MRLLHEFDERWDCAGLRLMENSFDNAHFSFVHMASFGNQAQPAPASIEITPLDYGLNMKTTVDVMNPPLQQKNLQLAAAKTVRMMDANWYIALISLMQYDLYNLVCSEYHPYETLFPRLASESCRDI